MPEKATQNTNPKAVLPDLEKKVKAAFNEGRYQDVRTFAEKIKALDPPNHLMLRLLEKTMHAEEEAKKKANAEKIKILEKQIEDAFKANRFEEVRICAARMAELDPKNSFTAKILSKIEMAKVEAEKRAKQEKIEGFEKTLKKAFDDKRFEDIRQIAAKIQEIDKENNTAKKYVGKIEEAKVEALKKAQEEKLKAEKRALEEKVKLERAKNAEKINALQDQVKAAFDAVRFADLRKTAEKLFEIDKENAFAKKYLKKAEIEELKAKGLYVSPWGKILSWFKRPAKAEVKKEVKPVAAVVATKPPAVMPTPAVAVKPVVAMPTPAVATKPPAVITPTPVAKPIEAKKVEARKEVAPAPATSGNVFTKLFGEKEVKPVEKPTKSIIETIVSKTPEKGAKKIEPPKPKKEEMAPGMGLLKFTKVFAQVAVAFIVVTAAFFYVENIDTNNQILGFFGVSDNSASRLHAAAQTLDEKKTEETNLNKDIKLYKKGYSNQYEQIINSIIQKRVNWPDVLQKINEITDSVNAQNEITQYIKYDSYSFDAENGTVTVSGSLTDPLGKNLTMLVRLEQAFRNYPRDITNPDDKTQPYFYDFKEFKSLSKTLDTQTGKYNSSFQLSFSTQPAPVKSAK